MKSLEKDRSRRYETANSLASDITRYLTDQPVEASPPSTAYRFRKFARRNRGAIVTASMLIAALVLGTVVSTWQAVRATRAEQRADEQAAIAEANARAALRQKERADAKAKEAEVSAEAVLKERNRRPQGRRSRSKRSPNCGRTRPRGRGSKACETGNGKVTASGRISGSYVRGVCPS